MDSRPRLALGGDVIVGFLRRRQPWERTLYLIWATQLINIFGLSTVFSFIPLFVQELGVTDRGQAAFWSGVSSGGFGLTMFLFGPIWGVLGDRVGRKRNHLRAVFGTAVLIGVTGLSVTMPQMVILRALTGIMAGSFVTSMALVAAVTPRPRLGYAMGILQTATFLGSTLGPFFGGLLASAAGFRSTFFLGSGLLGLSGVIIALTVREQFQPPAKTASGTGLGAVRDLWRLATGRELLSALTVILLVQGAPSMMSPVLPLFIQSISPGMAVASATGAAFSVLGLSSALSAYVSAWLTDRVGSRALVTYCSVGSGILYMPLLLVHSTPQVMGVMVGLGLLSGALLTSTSVLVGLAVPRERQSTAYGMMQSANALAFGAGPLAGGIVATTLGLRQVFLVTGITYILMGLMAVRVLSAKGGTAQAEGGKSSPGQEPGSSAPS